MRYSIEPRERIYVKGYEFLSFAKNMSNKYSQKFLDSAKKSTTDPIKAALNRKIQKTAETNGDLIGDKIADKITRVSKKSPKKLHSQNEDKIEITKDRYLSPEKKTTNYRKISRII